MGLLDDSDGSVHPRWIPRNVGGLPVHTGAVGLTKLVGGARRSQQFPFGEGVGSSSVWPP